MFKPCYWFILLLAVAGFLPTFAHGQVAAPELAPPSPVDELATQLSRTETVQSLVTSIVLENIPHQYEDKRKWGQTKQVFDGLKLRREGLRIETKRRWKQVNHGTWKRYHIWLIDPTEHFHVEIRNVRPAGGAKVSFDVMIDARVGAFARLSEWQLDVQLISLGVDAEARVRLQAECELGLKMDVEGYPPDILLVPEIKKADLELVDFRLQRVSNFSGPLIKELGEELHDVLAGELRKREEGLPAKINKQIAKRQDRLRWSLRY